MHHSRPFEWPNIKESRHRVARGPANPFETGSRGLGSAGYGHISSLCAPHVVEHRRRPAATHGSDALAVEARLCSVVVLEDLEEEVGKVLRDAARLQPLEALQQYLQPEQAGRWGESPARRIAHHLPERSTLDRQTCGGWAGETPCGPRTLVAPIGPPRGTTWMPPGHRSTSSLTG